jgi:hypothetical protein
MPAISQLNGGVLKPIPSLTDVIPVQEVGGNTVPVSVQALANRIGGGLSPWAGKNSNYTAIQGDRLRYTLNADTTITLPATPSGAGADIWIQRTEVSSNKLFIDPGANRIDGQATGFNAIFNPVDFRSVERLSWAGGSIGWLSQEGKLTYQNLNGDPLWAVVSFLLRATPSGFSDLKGAALTSSGAAVSTTAKFGHSVECSGAIVIPNAANLIPPTGDWTIDFWYRHIATSQFGALFSLDGSDFPLTIYLGNSFAPNPIAAVGDNAGWFTPNLLLGNLSTVAPVYFGVKRQGNTLSAWRDGVQTSSFTLASSTAIGIPSTNALIGQNGGNSCHGYYEEFRITKAARDLSIVPTAQFPSS